MTEEEWLACLDPGVMKEFIRGRVSERKVRLLAVACCRAFRPESSGHVFDRAAELLERRADEPMPVSVLGGAINAIYQASRVISGEDERCLFRAMKDLMGSAVDMQVLFHMMGTLWLFSARTGEDIHRTERQIVVDLFGNPFRPVRLHPAWRTPTVTDIAAAAYAGRALPSGHLDAARLAVLADALEEAGCTEADILVHLREAGPHVRGCWAVDLLLGKS